jgi:hypothetical protein
MMHPAKAGCNIIPSSHATRWTLSPFTRATLWHVLCPCSDPDRQTFRIGISGPPGVGKSTLIEAFGCSLLQRGLKVAVLVRRRKNVLRGQVRGRNQTKNGNLLSRADHRPVVHGHRRIHSWRQDAHAAPLGQYAGVYSAVSKLRRARCAARKKNGATLFYTLWYIVCVTRFPLPF